LRDDFGQARFDPLGSKLRDDFGQARFDPLGSKLRDNSDKTSAGRLDLAE
jgi:hypothetical protein